jgi:glycosyltransferase involved in cell wall biosynthesis
MASDLAVSNVQFERPVRYEQLSTLMSQAHLCLGIFGTSATAQHGIPNKVFFGLATKRPVVTGDTAVMRENFTHGENIWLCPIGDAAARADSILELKHRADLREKVAQRGYELFLKEFSIDAIKQELVSIIADANKKRCDLQDVVSERSIID